MEERSGGTEAEGAVKPWTCANAQFRVMPPSNTSKNRRKELVHMKEVAEEGINQTPYVEIQWSDGTKKKALFDTGAQWSLITEQLLTDVEKTEMSSTSLIGKGVTGCKIPVTGEIWRTVKIGNTIFEDQRFIVVKDMICSVILGIDFWSRVSHLSFDFENCTVRLGDTGDAIKLWSHPFTNEVVTVEGKADTKLREVLVAESTTVPAMSETYVKCSSTGLNSGQDYLIQPISEGDSLISTPFGVMRATNNEEFLVRVSNLSDIDAKLKKNFCIATLEQDVWINHPNSGQAFKNNSRQRKAAINWDDICDNNLDVNKKKQLTELLEKHKGIFHTGGKLPIVRVGVEHNMNLLKDAPPTVCRPRRLSQELADEVKDHIEKLIKDGVVRQSNSEWASPIVCARRSDGSLRLVIDYRLTNEKSRTATLHPIPLIDDLIDHLSGAKYFSTLDAKSGYHQMPLREGDSEATAFVVPWGHYEFADRCPFGLKGAGYSFQRMMSAILGSSNFIEALCYLDDILVWGETWEIHMQRLKRVLVKIEKSGLALSASKCCFGSTHVDYLGCRIGEGMIRISEQRVEQLRKIERPKNVKALRSALGAFAYVQRWIPGLSELARPLYDATTGNPYSRLRWDPHMDWAFEKIKAMIADAVALAIPDMTRGFVLVTDCSNIAAGALLAQEAEHGSKQLVPCAFYHHALSKPEQAYSATEKELLAIVLAVKKYRVYLGKRFKLITDHQALRWLKSLDPENETGRRGRWLDLLQQFDMEIIAKRGKSPEMRIADFLSRVNLTGSCNDTNTEKGLVVTLQDDTDVQGIGKQFLDVEALRQHQDKCTALAAIKEALKQGTDPNMGGSSSKDWRKPSLPEDREAQNIWSMKERLKIDDNGLLRLKFNGGRRTKENPLGCKERWRIIVPQSYKETVLEMVHASPTAAHMGTNRTWTRARNNFWWDEMKQDIDTFIRNCEMCSKNKHDTKPNAAPQSLSSIPKGPLEEIMVDFLGPFQEAQSHRYRYVLQLQDVFSRFLIFEPTIDSTAQTAAEVLKNRWLSIFGMPSSLRSDRGKHFTAEVFERLCELSGIKHKLGSPEHPQSQGQVERQNQLINQVRCLCENNIEKWPQSLYSVQCSHNGSTNSSTGYSPGRILLGKGFNNPEDIVLRDIHNTERLECLSKQVDAREEDDEVMMRRITERVRQSQEKRAESLNTRGTPYKVGDRVRYRLNNDTRSKKGGKLAPRYSEEYEVVDVLGDGYTYNLKAVNHDGRPKSRHFNLLKTVSRLGPNESSSHMDTVEVDYHPTVEMSDGHDGGDSPGGEDTPSRQNRDSQRGSSGLNQDRWVRRSRRERKNIEILQADGKKKSYSSSKVINFDDSD